MPFKHLMFANNCCIFAVKISGNMFVNRLLTRMMEALVVQWIE